MQDRLAIFAVKQAEYRADGWVTRHVEVSATLAEGETLAGKPLPLQIFGRIDRIDYHPDSGRWAIWDYKTSDGGAHPVRNHFQPKLGWTDLQLPLYRHLVLRTGDPARCASWLHPAAQKRKRNRIRPCKFYN